MAQRGVGGENITLTIPVPPNNAAPPNYVSDPQRFNALTIMLASEMGQQVCNMYDEFRIRSCKVKITPILTNAVVTGNLTMHSAWDRNGSLMRISLADDGGAAVYATFNEGAHDLRTYSSLQSKHLLQFQNGSIARTIAAAGMPDTLWYPTAYARSLVAAAWLGNEDAINDYRER